MANDGFTSYEGNAVMWRVYHNGGTTFVHATSEAIALYRFMAKYPDKTVKKIERVQCKRVSFRWTDTKRDYRNSAMGSIFIKKPGCN